MIFNVHDTSPFGVGSMYCAGLTAISYCCYTKKTDSILPFIAKAILIPITFDRALRLYGICIEASQPVVPLQWLLAEYKMQKEGFDVSESRWLPRCKEIIFDSDFQLDPEKYLSLKQKYIDDAPFWLSLPFLKKRVIPYIYDTPEDDEMRLLQEKAKQFSKGKSPGTYHAIQKVLKNKFFRHDPVFFIKYWNQKVGEKCSIEKNVLDFLNYNLIEVQQDFPIISHLAHGILKEKNSYMELFFRVVFGVSSIKCN